MDAIDHLKKLAFGDDKQAVADKAAVAQLTALAEGRPVQAQVNRRAALNLDSLGSSGFDDLQPQERK